MQTYRSFGPVKKTHTHNTHKKPTDAQQSTFAKKRSSDSQKHTPIKTTMVYSERKALSATVHCRQGKLLVVDGMTRNTVPTRRVSCGATKADGGGRRRVVRFSDENMEHEYERPVLSRKEIRALHYQKYDLADMSTEANKTARKVFGSHRKQDPSRKFRDNEDDFRGLETYVGMGLQVRRVSRKRALVAVFKEQRRQKAAAREGKDLVDDNNNCSLDERIALVYSAECIQCKRLARERGRRYVVPVSRKDKMSLQPNDANKKNSMGRVKSLRNLVDGVVNRRKGNKKASRRSSC